MIPASGGSSPKGRVARTRRPDACGAVMAGSHLQPYGGSVFWTGRRATRHHVAGRSLAVRIATAGLLAGVLLTGCTVLSTAPASTTPGTNAPPEPRPLPPTSTAPPDAPVATQVQLPWPAPTASEAAALQAEVDRGAQPWLLDPSEVAIAYAAAAHDWPDAEAYPGPDGTSVDIRNADGERRTLMLAQPAKKGSDGIWVVTAERP
jgi:hypothetical protein